MVLSDGANDEGKICFGDDSWLTEGAGGTRTVREEVEEGTFGADVPGIWVRLDVNGLCVELEAFVSARFVSSWARGDDFLSTESGLGAPLGKCRPASGADEGVSEVVDCVLAAPRITAPCVDILSFEAASSKAGCSLDMDDDV